jgi:hypothetical protein
MEELMEVRQLGQLLDLIQGKLAARDGAASTPHDDLRSTAA